MYTQVRMTKHNYVRSELIHSLVTQRKCTAQRKRPVPRKLGPLGPVAARPRVLISDRGGNLSLRKMQVERPNVARRLVESLIYKLRLHHIYKLRLHYIYTSQDDKITSDAHI